MSSSPDHNKDLYVSSFWVFKIAVAALMGLSIIAIVADYYNLDHAEDWFDLVKLTVTFLLGGGIATGVSRRRS